MALSITSHQQPADAMFYIDSDSFLTATAVYDDPYFETLASDGVYQDCGVFRVQQNGVLGAPTNCPICTEDCDPSTVYSISDYGSYSVQVNLTSDIGDVEVTFSPFTNAQSLSVIYGGTVYTGYYTPSLTTFISEPYLGVDPSAGGCDVVASTPVDLQVYSWSPADAAFEPVGGAPTNVNVTLPQVHYEPGGPLIGYVLRFPKNSTTDNTAQVILNSPCKGSNAEFYVSCPKPYLRYPSTTTQTSEALACSTAATIDIYVAQALGSATVSLGEFAFSDKYGRSPLADGVYGIVDRSSQKQATTIRNGRITSITVCP